MSILQFNNNAETVTNRVEYSNSLNKRDNNNLNSMQSSSSFDKLTILKSSSLDNENINNTNIFQYKYNDVNFSLDVNNFDLLIDNEQFELIKNDFNNSNVFDNI